jgi:uncharacterized protein (DUF1800 family)
MASNQIKNQHLLWRAGFGPAAEGLNQLSLLTPIDLYAVIKKASSLKPEYLDATDNYFKGLFKGIGEEGKRIQMDKEGLKMLQQKSKDQIKNLNLLWLDEMVYSNAQLREKMAFFWHGHFASRNLNVFFQQQLLDILRQHALGNFRDMLHEVSKSAAMLFFLNAAQNVKAHPNENFAREVMELFTLGRGNYTEQDVKEASRAFTGWGANVKGDFVFRDNLHDEGRKTVLGISGKLNGEDVLDILLEQKQTAVYISQKIYRFFVNENIDIKKVDWLADRFYKSNYHIGQLMDDIFTSEWFYDEKNIGTKIKSPIELLAGIRRMLPMELQNEESQLLLQRLLGQVLFVPPNVAGWPGGKAWIDSSTLMFRLRLPKLISDEDDLNAKPKDDDDLMMGKMDAKQVSGKQATAKAPQVNVDWNAYAKNFDAVARENLISLIGSSLLQVNPAFSEAIIKSYVNSNDRQSFIRSATIQMMSTPEYQLC